VFVLKDEVLLSKTTITTTRGNSYI